jgi:hypothetical protein
VVYALLLVVGPASAVASAVVKQGDEAKKERLASVGVPVTATVTDRDWSNSQSRDKTTLSYQVDGQTYTSTITGLPSGPTMTLRVDPDDPSAFVAENGSTDQSRNPLNRWANVPWGAVLAALGVAGVIAHRRAKAQPGAAPAATLSGRPPRKTTTPNKRKGKR